MIACHGQHRTRAGDEADPGDVLAVQVVDLAIADGELMVLVGPSGCGKSTILRLIARLERPIEGDVRIGDRVVNELVPGDRKMAMVFQDYALYPHLSVYGNIAFALKPTVRSRAELDKAGPFRGSDVGPGAAVGQEAARAVRRRGADQISMTMHYTYAVPQLAAARMDQALWGRS